LVAALAEADTAAHLGVVDEPAGGRAWRIIDEMERDYERRLGRSRYRGLREGLAEVLSDPSE
jgi:hypothetical protein